MADKIDKKTVTEVAAYARGIHMSPRKVRLVVDLLRGLPAPRALARLQFVTKKAVIPVRKLIQSAVANASHNFQIESERLFVKNFTVDGGPAQKRFKPRAQGRAFPIRRPSSNLNLILGVSEKPLVPKTEIKARPAAADVKDLKKEETKPKAPKEETEQKQQAPQKGWQRWFGRKGRIATKDIKGKKYASFDRRGGE